MSAEDINGSGIAPEDPLARFIYSSSLFSRDNQRVKHNAFMPGADSKTSVFETKGLDEPVTWISSTTHGKGGVWNLFQPVSMDLLDADSILDKANRWLGRATNLKDSDDKFRLWMLNGEPRIGKLKPAYGKALNILEKMPVEKDFVTEQDAQKFSEQLAQEMAEHPAGS